MKLNILISAIVLLSGCHSYYAEYSAKIDNYTFYDKVVPVGTKKEDIQILIDNNAKMIGVVGVFGFPNSHNRNEPIDAAIQSAIRQRATHIVFMQEDVVDKEYNCTTHAVYGNTTFINCSESSQMGYYYNLYVVPKENWKNLPKNLQPKEE